VAQQGDRLGRSRLEGDQKFVPQTFKIAIYDQQGDKYLDGKWVTDFNCHMEVNVDLDPGSYRLKVMVTDAWNKCA